MITKLLWHSFTVTPSVKTASKALRFFAHDCQKEFPGSVRLFCAKVLDVDLCGFVAKFDLNLRASWAHPEEHLITGIQNHDVIMSQVILKRESVQIVFEKAKEFLPDKSHCTFHWQWSSPFRLSIERVGHGSWSLPRGHIPSCHQGQPRRNCLALLPH